MIVERSGGGAILPVTQAQIEVHFSARGVDGATMAAFEDYVRAAVSDIEGAASIALMLQTITVTLDEWPSAEGRDAWWDGARDGPISATANIPARLQLPVGPVLAGAISSVTIIAPNGTETAVPTESLRLTPGLFASASIIEGVTLPAGEVRIAYAAGYGSDESAVPANLRHAVLDQALRLYERRGDEAGGDASLSPAAARAVNAYRPVRL